MLYKFQNYNLKNKKNSVVSSLMGGKDFNGGKNKNKL